MKKSFRAETKVRHLHADKCFVVNSTNSNISKPMYVRKPSKPHQMAIDVIPHLFQTNNCNSIIIYWKNSDEQPSSTVMIVNNTFAMRMNFLTINRNEKEQKEIHLLQQ